MILDISSSDPEFEIFEGTSGGQQGSLQNLLGTLQGEIGNLQGGLGLPGLNTLQGTSLAGLENIAMQLGDPSLLNNALQLQGEAEGFLSGIFDQAGAGVLGPEFNANFDRNVLDPLRESALTDFRDISIQGAGAGLGLGSSRQEAGLRREGQFLDSVADARAQTAFDELGRQQELGIQASQLLPQVGQFGIDAQSNIAQSLAQIFGVGEQARQVQAGNIQADFDAFNAIAQLLGQLSTQQTLFGLSGQESQSIGIF